MVNGAERLILQQQQLRASRREVDLQVQQQALRRGVSPQQILIEREQRKVQAEIQKERKQQASDIDKTLAQATSIQQATELFNQIPQELRQFIKNTPKSFESKQQSNINQIKEFITKRETRRGELQNRRNELLARELTTSVESQIKSVEGNITAVEIEVDALNRGIGLLNQGNIISPSAIISNAGNIGEFISQTKEINIQNRQELSKALGRKVKQREVSKLVDIIERIEQTQKITPIQAKILGLELEKLEVPKIVKPTIEAQPIRPGGFEMLGGGFNLLIDEGIGGLGGIDIAGLKELPLLPGMVTQEPGELPKLLTEREIARKQEILSTFPGIKLGDIKPVSFIETIADIEQLGKDIIFGGEQILGFGGKLISESLFEEEEAIAERGRFIPTDPFQITARKRETLKFQPQFLKEEELASQIFGGGLEEISRRKVRQAEVELSNFARTESDRILPPFKKRAEDKSIELQNKVNKGKLSSEEANIELKEFMDNLNIEFGKKLGSNVENLSKILSSEITKDIKDINQKNFIKKELILLTATIPTGFALGFVGRISPIIAKGLVVFGAVEVAKTAPIVVTAIKQGDVQTLGAIGIQFGGFAVGGFIGAKVGGKFIQARVISNAIKRSNIESKTIAKNIEVLRKVKLSPELKVELKTLIDRGFSVRVVETKLVASTLADGKIIPDVRGRFIEIINRKGVIVDVISIGSVISKVKGKIFSQEIISESVGKIDGGKSEFVTRSVIGKLKGDKFIPIKEIQTFQETTLTSRKVTPKGELTLSESITKLLAEGKVKGKPRDITKITKGIIGETGGLKPLKIDLKGLESQLLKGRRGKVISKTELASLKELTGIDFSIDTVSIGELLTSIKQTKAKTFGFTINVPEIKIKPRPKPRDTLREVFGAGTEIPKKFDFKFPKFDFKEFFKTKDGQAFQQQTKQINKNLDLLTQTTAPEVITKAIAKPKVKPPITSKLVFGKIPGLDLDSTFGNLGVLGSKLNTELLSDLDLGQEQKRKQQQLGVLDTGLLIDLGQEQQRKKITVLSFPDITKTIDDLDQIQLPILAQPQIQTQRQLQQLKINLTGFGIDPLTITIPDIPITPPPPVFFDFEEKKKRKLLPKGKDIGFDLFVKSRGRKKKVNKVPLMENTALDYGSFLVDNTISQQFSIKKTKKFAQNPKANIPRNYWELNKNKFNDFVIRKGKKVPTPNSFQEKRGNAIDTFGEIRNLRVSRLIKQRQNQNRDMQRINRNINNIFGFPSSQKPRKKKTRK